VNVVSTRGSGPVPLSAAIAAGQAPDGGLYLPPTPVTPAAAFGDTFVQRAERTLETWFAGDTLAAVLGELVRESFTFDAPIRWLDEHTGLLELFHGPTAAFKDFGARFLAACLARLPSPAAVRTVLVATSGDTGAAVAAAFWRKPGFRVVVLYPDGRVSPRQAHQLAAFGDNVTTFRVAGAFDDCQRLVKAAFADPALTRRHALVSANSISLGRLLPQATYYVHAALEAAARGRPRPDVAQPNIAVPTGNLGNAFACLLARDLLAAVGHAAIGDVLVATNDNRVIGDFVTTGRYEPRTSVATIANAMDVGAPSNLERLRSRYGEPPYAGLGADAVDDATIRQTIRHVDERFGVAVCPHTACGLAALARRRTAGDDRTWLVAATAHPAKFETVVEPLVGRTIPVPPGLADLLARPATARPLAPTPTALQAALEASQVTP
jgi:threonine synthase